MVLVMYHFHYNYIMKTYGHKTKLFFTDTDSLMYKIERKDVYKDFHKDKDKYPDDLKFYD